MFNYCAGAFNGNDNEDIEMMEKLNKLRPEIEIEELFDSYFEENLPRFSEIYQGGIAEDGFYDSDPYFYEKMLEGE